MVAMETNSLGVGRRLLESGSTLGLIWVRFYCISVYIGAGWLSGVLLHYIGAVYKAAFDYGYRSVCYTICYVHHDYCILVFYSV